MSHDFSTVLSRQTAVTRGKSIAAWRFLATCLYLAASPALLQATEANWPQFRGPGAQGISASKDVPVAWSATDNVAWKVALAGRGWSSPVLSEGKVYVTAAVPVVGSSDVTLHAFCLSASDGRILWDTQVFQPDAASTAAMHRKNSLASPTPVVAGERLYVHFGHMGTAALDLSGKIIWTQTDLKYAPIHGTGGSPALAGDTLVFSCDGEKDAFVAGLDAATGSIRWKTPRNTKARKQFSFSTPLAISIANKWQVISPGSGFAGSYDPADGRELWRVNYGEGYSVVPRPVYAHGLLFLSSGFDAPSVYAIAPEGAEGDATVKHTAWTLRKGAPHTPSLLVVGDELYFVSDSGIATCADARTGKVHWTERLGGGFSASPFSAEGKIYFLNETGTGFVVKAAKTFVLISKNELGEPTLASPAPADGAIYIRSEGHLWKIGK